MTRLVRIAVVLIVWLALWSDVSVANVASGLLVAAFVVVGFDTWRRGQAPIRPIRAARFVVFFAFLLVKSTFSVARTVLAPRSRVYTGILAVPLPGCSDAVVTVIADSISLTPGTLTLEVRPDPLTLYVHVLDVRDIDSVRKDIRTLEILAIRAFGDADALAGLVVDDTTVWRSSFARPSLRRGRR